MDAFIEASVQSRVVAAGVGEVDRPVSWRVRTVMIDDKKRTRVRNNWNIFRCSRTPREADNPKPVGCVSGVVCATSEQELVETDSTLHHGNRNEDTTTGLIPLPFRRRASNQPEPDGDDALGWLDGKDGDEGSLLGAVAIVDPPELLEPEPEEDPEPPSAIDCSHVSKYFGQFCALDDVSFRIEQGEVVSIIGRSGSGKSTMLRCINGLEQVSAGDICVDGLAVTTDSFTLRQLRERVGMVFQNFNLFPQYSVVANVVLAQRVVLGRSSDEAEATAVDALDRVEMRRHSDKYPAQLSGGEQQRVAIARALAMNPRVMLLDEPTASIDPELTKGIMSLVREIAEGEMTVVVVTHEMGFMKAAADRVFFFEDGRLLEHGPVERIVNEPDHPSTRRFLADARLLH